MKPLSKTQNAFISGLVTLLVTALWASFAGFHPYAPDGKLDWGEVSLYLTVTVIPALFATIVAYIKTHPQEALQAAEDTLREIPQIPSDVIDLLKRVEGQLQQSHIAGPLVVVHPPQSPVAQPQPQQGVQPVPPIPVSPVMSTPSVGAVNIPQVQFPTNTTASVGSVWQDTTNSYSLVPPRG